MQGSPNPLGITVKVLVIPKWMEDEVGSENISRTTTLEAIGPFSPSTPPLDHQHSHFLQYLHPSAHPQIHQSIHPYIHSSICPSTLQPLHLSNYVLNLVQFIVPPKYLCNYPLLSISTSTIQVWATLTSLQGHCHRLLTAPTSHPVFHPTDKATSYKWTPDNIMSLLKALLWFLIALRIQTPIFVGYTVKCTDDEFPHMCIPVITPRLRHRVFPVLCAHKSQLPHPPM